LTSIDVLHAISGLELPDGTLNLAYP